MVTACGKETQGDPTSNEGDAEVSVEEQMGLKCPLPNTHNEVKQLTIGCFEDEVYKKLIEELQEKNGISFGELSSDDMKKYSELKSKKGYEIVDKRGKITIAASNSEMLYVALTKVLYGEEQKNYTESYQFPTREEYIKNPDTFVTAWEYLWSPPEWLLSYDEKQEAFNKHTRPMIWAHRGGSDYYPDNSIEAIISSIQMGADVMELDFRYTKDGVLVLIHDETLYSSTDWAKKKGKNGLPTSDKVQDWTYDELQQLNLKSGNVFSRLSTSEYKIPTLEEVLQVCEGRVFFVMDKINTYEEWDTIHSAITNTKCASAFAFAYKFPSSEVGKAQIQLKNEFGKCGPYFYLKKHSGDLETEALGTEQRLHVYDKCSSVSNAAIMTNYVRDLVEYVDRNYGEK